MGVKDAMGRKIGVVRIAVMLGVVSSTLMSVVGAAKAEEIGCVKTAFQLIGPDNQICVEAFDDPKIPGVSCHLSQAKTGGLGGALGIATDPSRFSIACRQVGPVSLPNDLKDRDLAFSTDTSPFFKETRVARMIDKKRNTLIYLVYSTKLINGSPFNSISTVPIMPWSSKP
ncbi:Protein CreA [Azospirillaceae bacterium]